MSNREDEPAHHEILGQIIDELDFLLPAVKQLDAEAANKLSSAIFSLQMQAKPVTAISDSKRKKKANSVR